MKLSVYAKKIGVSYKTAWRYWNQGHLKGYQTPTGTIIIDAPEEKSSKTSEIKALLYSRVSSPENKKNLDTQAKRLEDFAAAKGYVVYKHVKEIGSGLNDRRPKLLDALKNSDFDILLVEHKDRLARFGVSYIQLLLEMSNRKLEIINTISDDEQDIIQDFISVITSMTARIYGKRRSNRKTAELIKSLKSDD